MKYYITLLHDSSLKISKDIQDSDLLPPEARQFVCSSNVTVQDIYLWSVNGFKGLKSIKEMETVE